MGLFNSSSHVVSLARLSFRTVAQEGKSGVSRDISNESVEQKVQDQSNFERDSACHLLVGGWLVSSSMCVSKLALSPRAGGKGKSMTILELLLLVLPLPLARDVSSSSCSPTSPARSMNVLSLGSKSSTDAVGAVGSKISLAPKLPDRYRAISGLSVEKFDMPEDIDVIETGLDWSSVGVGGCRWTTLGCVSSGIENPRPRPTDDRPGDIGDTDMDLSTSHSPRFVSDGRTLIFLLAFLSGNMGNGPDGGTPIGVARPDVLRLISDEIESLLRGRVDNGEVGETRSESSSERPLGILSR